MFIRSLLCLSLVAGGCSGVCLVQDHVSSTGVPPTSPAQMPKAQAFPLIMNQNVVAGKAPVGSKVQASLGIATLVNGTVIPQGAVFSGEVIESQAMNSSEPSRLSIRIDSAQWKNGSLPMRAYLTQWYYPLTWDAGPDLHGPAQSPKRTWNGMGQYPAPKSPAYEPFPAGADSEQGSPASGESSTTADHPVKLKDVESEPNSAGGITLVSSRLNLKLDKRTTYVFSSIDIASSQAR